MPYNGMIRYLYHMHDLIRTCSDSHLIGSFKAYIEAPSQRGSFEAEAMAEVNPAGETGYNKRKATKKQEGDNARKRTNLNLDLSKVKKGMIQTTLDQWLIKPRTPTRVRFRERVILKRITPHMESWTSIPLKGFSDPGSAFARKRLEGKRQMARDH